MIYLAPPASVACGWEIIFEGGANRLLRQRAQIELRVAVLRCPVRSGK